MNNVIRASVLCAGLSLLGIQPVLAAEPTVDEIATNAYLYFYPLLTMDLTRLQLTNVPPGKISMRGPANTFSNAPAFPPADFKVVVRPNFDTLYSVAWLDLTAEPLIVSARTPMAASTCCPCWTCGATSSPLPAPAPPAPSQPITWSPRSAGAASTRRVTRIEAPTAFVWIIGRTKTDGPSDYPAVHKIQAGLGITPLSAWGKPPVSIVAEDRPDRGHEDPAQDPGRHHVRHRLLRLCGRTAQAARAPPHRPAHRRPDEEHRRRTRQQLRPRQPQPRPCWPHSTPRRPRPNS